MGKTPLSLTLCLQLAHSEFAVEKDFTMLDLHQLHILAGGDGPAPAGKHVPFGRVPAILVHDQAVAHV